MKTKNIILIVLIGAIVLGVGLCLWFQNRGHAVVVKRGGQLEIWYCPMHPHYTSDHPGQCPICGMDLVKRKPTQNNSNVQGYATIFVTSQKQEMIGLRTQVVNMKPLEKVIRTFGTISSNIELYKIQNQYIDAFVSYVNVHRNYKRINDRNNPWGIHRDIQTSLLEAQDNLLKLGLSKREMDKLQNVSWNQIRRQPKLLMFNDSQSYWVKAQVFEGDYRFVHEGQEVEVSIPALQVKIKGIIRSVGGFIDPTNRSATVLIKFNNDTSELAANMFVDITIPVKLGNALLVPRASVMDTGLRKIVFVRKGDTFEPREIQTGLETDDGFEVNSGLQEGERIVVSGNFLLDSESRVQAGLLEDIASTPRGEKNVK